MINENVTRHAEALAIRRMDTIDNLALTALKGLTIVNGGALVAILAFLAQGGESQVGRGIDARLVIFAAIAFATGLTLVMVGNLLGYLAQQDIQLIEQQTVLALLNEDSAGYSPEDAKVIDGGNARIKAAGAAVGISILSFAAGCTLLACAALGSIEEKAPRRSEGPVAPIGECL